MIEVVKPTLVEKARIVQMAPRLNSLQAKTMGTLWNRRSNGDRLMRSVAQLLDARHGFASQTHVTKPYVGNKAPTEVFDELRKCDAVIVGVGD